ncbi:MAG: CYTH domain-containing protein, partial [Chloroflexota bacterium]|nr:CYTH domain-containing protein [Chloroflexota bacterium]
MTDEPGEIEAKFTVDDDDRERLAVLDSVGMFRVVSRSTAEQDDLYFDTEDRVLAGCGSTLRIRRTPTSAFMTFKGPRQLSGKSGESHIANRMEDEVEIAREYADAAVESPAIPERSGLS